MSVAQFQRTVNTFDKEISDMEKKKAAKDKNIAALEIKINSTQKSITKNTAFSIHDSKLRQISHWERERTNKLKESAELSAKIADKKKKRSEAYSKLQKAANEEYDVFVSHAWEDKKDFVDELVFEMRKCGIKVWYDTDRLNCGDSMREKIDKGLSKSKYGVIVVLSPNYISENKYWTKDEINGLFQVETINGKTILPIWHRLTKKQVTEYSPIIAARRALTTADFTAEEIAKKLKELFSDTRNLKMHTPNKADENYKKLAELFPNALTETIDEVTGEVVRAIDKDVLMQEINTKVVDGKEERYQFTWPDKNKYAHLAYTPINKTLRPCREESVDFDNTENLYIEGDNLEVLKLLQETYLGKIKMIYIDPPYNTGNDFVYDDDFAQSTDEYSSNSGQFDDEGNRLVKNLESNGRFHTDWLNMMYPRLKLAKNLMTDDGAIFISIDENEVNTLKNVCDEIFGASNFIAELIWAAGRKNDSKYISISHEYIICYFRNINYIKENKIIWREKKQGLNDIYAEYELLKKLYGDDYERMTKELKSWYKSLPDGHPAKDHSHYNRIDEKGIYFADNISWPGGGGPKYEILHPITHKPVKIPSRGWLTNEKTMRDWIQQGRVEFSKDERSVPTLKSYLKDREYTVPYSVFYKDGRAASKRLAALLGDKVFENPKDEEIIERLIEFCGVSDGDYILDFFSGSGTTAHATFLANVEQQENRHFILVQIPEEISEKKVTSEKSKRVAKNAIALCDNLCVSHTICEIGKERIRRAGRKIKEESPLTTQNLDIGFRVLKCDSSNMKDVYYNSSELTIDNLADSVDNIKEDRTPEDLLFQVMLDMGIILSSKIEETTIAGKKVFNVADGFLIACFDADVTDETIIAVAKQKPYYFVMRDSSMANDSVATNFDQIFATYSPDTVRKVL